MTDAVNCQCKLPNTSRSQRLLFASRNTTDWKVFLQLRSLQVIETSQSAIARHDGTEGDRVKRLREILFLFFLYYPWRTLSVCDASCCPISFLGMWDLPPSAATCVSSLSAGRVWSYKAGEWKWASCYRSGRSPDHSLSDRCLISADSVLREVRGSLHHTRTVQTLIRY